MLDISSTAKNSFFTILLYASTFPCKCGRTTFSNDDRRAVAELSDESAFQVSRGKPGPDRYPLS